MTFPKRSDVDNSNGKVRCWDVITKKYVFKYPIDVREGMILGVITQHPENSKDAAKVKDDNANTVESVEKATAKQLATLIEEHQLSVDLSTFEKLAEKRTAVLEALNEKLEA
jgi:hypothetical protein